MHWTLRNRELGNCRARGQRPRAPIAPLVLATLALLTCARGVSAQRSASSEYQVKAAFLFHFAQFVDWPPEAFTDSSSPITYCTIGEELFQGALDASLNGKMIDNRPLRVQHLKKVQQIQGCQVLFIGSGKKKFIADALAALNGSATLTVGDSEHFVQEGGMIGFCLEDNKIRFEINLGAAEHAKLQISAKLLARAKTVIPGAKGI